MTGRITTSAISYRDRLPAIPTGIAQPRRRDGLARWLTFLAAAWLPNHQPTLKGR